MAESSCPSSGCTNRESLQRYVTLPVDIAIKRVHQEQAEVAAEKAAFEEFSARLSDFATVSNTNLSKLDRRITGESTHTRQVRKLYHDTVMSTDHYDSEYGDPCIESIRAEFGADVAAVLDSKDPVPFTNLVKQRVLEAANRCANVRSDLLKHVKAESDSLSQAHSEITDILNRLDTSQLPLHHESPLMSQLEGIAAVRQNNLRQHSVPGSIDEISFCELLYSEERWTFPVLVAVGRFREVTVKGCVEAP